MNFTASKFEIQLIRKIVKRMAALCEREGIEFDFVDSMMDMEACHCNGSPLDLQKLLNAPDGDFGHDVFGIRRFLDRSTGELTDCFSPRCSMQMTAA